MPERFRDVLGRMVSKADTANLLAYFRETYEVGSRKTLSRDLIELSPSNWHDAEWAGGGIVRTADGETLTDDAFNQIPDGVASFQVRFVVPYNPDYPRGWASYSTVDASEWENIDSILEDGGRDFGATGVGAIIFHQYT